MQTESRLLTLFYLEITKNQEKKNVKSGTAVRPIMPINKAEKPDVLSFLPTHKRTSDSHSPKRITTTVDRTQNLEKPGISLNNQNPPSPPHTQIEKTAKLNP